MSFVSLPPFCPASCSEPLITSLAPRSSTSHGDESFPVSSGSPPFCRPLAVSRQPHRFSPLPPPSTVVHSLDAKLQNASQSQQHVVFVPRSRAFSSIQPRSRPASPPLNSSPRGTRLPCYFGYFGYFKFRRSLHCF